MLAGIVSHRLGVTSETGWAVAFIRIGEVWIRCLEMVIVPMIAAQILVAVAGAAGGQQVGRLAGLSLAFFVGTLVIAGLFAVVVVPLVLGVMPLAGTLSADPVVSAEAVAAASTSSDGGGHWIDLVPRNPIRSAADGDLLPLLVYTALLGLALQHVTPNRRTYAVEAAAAVAEASFVLIRWLLLVAPIGVFALAFSSALRVGTTAASAVALYILLLCSTLTGLCLLLYPLTAVVGRMSIRRFARGAVPAQIVALATRSSLASLPALTACAHRLGVSRATSALTLPLAVASYKVNRPLSSTAKLLLLSHLYGFELTAQHLGAFVVAAFLLSFTTPGLPEVGGTRRTLPFYLAAGAPLEGVMLLGAAKIVPDFFKTLVNVTADLSAAVVVDRWGGIGRPGTPTGGEGGDRIGELAVEDLERGAAELAAPDLLGRTR